MASTPSFLWTLSAASVTAAAIARAYDDQLRALERLRWWERRPARARR